MRTEPLRFSIVIPTYNRKDTLRRCLAAATSQDYPDYEVIVVDDASTDGTDEMVRREFPQVRYIRQEPNRGPAAARNRGIEAATGEVIAFTDDDCVPPPGWLSQLADGLSQHHQAAAVGGIQEAPASLLQNNRFAQYEHFVTHWVYRVGIHPVQGRPAPCGTNNLAVSRDLLHRLGGFDEHFLVAAGEDADLLYRIAQAGYFTVSLPVKVVHYQPYTWRHFVRQQIRRGEGAFWFQRKHGCPYSLAREVIRLFLSPWTFLKTWVRSRRVWMALLHALSGFFQTWGRLRARFPSPSPKAMLWRVSPSPIKQRYLRWACGSTVLDIGTGKGFYGTMLQERGMRVVGVDLHPAQGLSFPVVLARLSALPFSSPFDTVLAFDVLEHEEAGGQALQELRRLTQQRLIISVPNADHSRLPLYNLTYKHHIDKSHYRAYDIGILRAKLEAAGFRVLLMTKEGPVHPAVFSEFVRPALLRPLIRLLLHLLFRLKVLDNPDLRADLYAVAEAG